MSQIHDTNASHIGGSIPASAMVPFSGRWNLVCAFSCRTKSLISNLMMASSKYHQQKKCAILFWGGSVKDFRRVDVSSKVDNACTKSGTQNVSFFGSKPYFLLTTLNVQLRMRAVFERGTCLCVIENMRLIAIGMVVQVARLL